MWFKWSDIFMYFESKYLLGGPTWDMTKRGILSDAEGKLCVVPSEGLRHRTTAS